MCNAMSVFMYIHSLPLWCLDDRGVWYALLTRANKPETAVQSSAFLFSWHHMVYASRDVYGSVSECYLTGDVCGWCDCGKCDIQEELSVLTCSCVCVCVCVCVCIRYNYYMSWKELFKCMMLTSGPCVLGPTMVL